MPLTLLLGGARSGKSALAARLAGRWDGPVTVVVTGEARDGEMADRIRRHRAGRPGHWRTVEAPHEPEAALAAAPADTFVVLDCLTLWVANLTEQGLDDGRVEAMARSAAATAAARAAPTVAVSNEVGAGIVPADAPFPGGSGMRRPGGMMRDRSACPSRTLSYSGRKRGGAGVSGSVRGIS